MSLTELLISLSLISCIVLCLFPLYVPSYQSFSMGAVEINQAQRARTVVQRIALELRSAVAADDQSPPIFSPALNAQDSSIVFTRADGDFLTFDARAPRYRQWVIWYDSDNRRIEEDRASDDGNSWVFVRWIGNSQLNGDPLQNITLADISFLHLRANTVRVTLVISGQTAGASGRRNDETYTAVTDIPIPCFGF